MGLMDLFKGKDKDAKPPKAPGKWDALAAYDNMRVEVTTLKGQLLFVGKLRNLEGDGGELFQFSGPGDDEPEDLPGEEAEEKEAEPVRVLIRGYLAKERKSVHMEGLITPQAFHVWKVENLEVTGTGNDRAFFRLETDTDATATTIMGMGVGDHDCHLLDISVGGARILSKHVYSEGDKFLLKVRLLEERDLSAMFCQVIRVIDRGDDGFEYGCRFLELNEADQDKITENIFAVQRKQRNERERWSDRLI